jgi:hypothetical protein
VQKQVLRMIHNQRNEVKKHVNMTKTEQDIWIEHFTELYTNEPKKIYDDKREI